MGKIITFFNHKGGVGKTTTVYNLATSLANKGKKVLVIDADPQMNLTASIYGLGLGVKYSKKIKTQEDYIIEEEKVIYDQNNMWLENQKTYISLNEFLEYYLYPGQRKSNDKKACYRKSQKNGGFIDLISGSINTVTIEVALYSAITNAIKSGRELLGNFQLAIDELKTSQIYDFILIDSAPNASSVLTALLVLLGDYWIAPVIPSFYSLQAIDNLSDIMKSWREYDDGAYFGLSRFSKKPDKVIKITTKFLGILIQQSKRYKVSSGSSQGWIDDLNRRLKDYFEYEKAQHGSSTVISGDDFKVLFPAIKDHKERKPHIIYSCYDFTQNLRSIADRAGVALIELTNQHCKDNKQFDGFDSNGKVKWKRAIVNLDSYKGQITAKGLPRNENQYFIAFDETIKAYELMANDLINNLHKI